MSAGVDHREVGARLAQGGALTGGYLMLTAVSAAIAILGLLLSSPAVVIGAMLLSPLMGPILLLGLSFWTVDWAATRKALGSLGVGFGIALAVSIALTYASPLKEPTSEILARSRPTLFDLLVAVFSGLAGGYAVVRRRGEAVIGVAIATALMPPLAVVGFGVGTGAWKIAAGALLLFFTNLIAIALAVAAVAAASGFRPLDQRVRRGWFREVAVLLVVAGLCAPLTVSLHQIALEGRATARTRADIAGLFGRKARVVSLLVTRGRGGLEATALVATPKYVAGASASLARALRAHLHAPVRVNLEQVVLADPDRLSPTPAPPIESDTAPDPAERAAADLRLATPYPDSRTIYDADSATGYVLLGNGSGLDLSGARALEKALRRQPGQEHTVVLPAARPLPPLVVTPAGRSVALGPAEVQRWALARWRSPSATAELCRHGERGVRLAAVRDALSAAFAPLPVELVVGSAADCGSSTRLATVLLANGPPAAAPGDPSYAPPEPLERKHDQT